MKKLTKKLAIVALSATLAVSAGAALGVVAYSQAPITASAAETAAVDLKDAFTLNTWGNSGDYKEALLYRITSPSNTTYWSATGTSAGANDAIGETVLKSILVNGKSIYDHNAEYKALIESGATSPITWTGMPNAATDGTRYMQGNIAQDVAAKTAKFAPIFVNCCNHGAAYGNTIDLYIPTSYLAKEDVNSIVIGKDFYLEKNGTSFGVSEDVVFEKNALGIPMKKVDISKYEIKETAVTKVDGSSNSATSWDSFLRFYLGESDYANCNTTPVSDKAFLHSLNFFDHILLNGKPFIEYYENADGTVVDPATKEMYYNVWGNKNSFGLRWPDSLNSTEAAGAITEIKVLAGCQFPSATAFGSVIYQTAEDKTFIVTGSNVYSDTAYMFDSEDITISEMVATGDEGELYRVDVSYENWNSTCDIYDYNYFGTHYLNMRKAILINGKSLHEINTTVDDSAYVYSTNPWTNTSTDSGTGYQLFQNPTLLTGEGDTLSIYLHKDYVASLEVPYVEVTLAKGFANHANSEYWASEDITAYVWKAPLTVSVITGNPRDPQFVTTVDCLYGDTFKVSELAVPEAVGKTFAGWTDVESNAITEDFVVTESTAIYADWTIEVHTLTIVNGETTTEIKFGVENDGTLDATVAELAWILEGELPAETQTHTYAWAEELPETFELKDYTFTVVAAERVYTVSVITGNPRVNPDCVTTTEHKYNDTFKVSELVVPEAVGKTFAGWTDVEGNAITEDFVVTESTAIYAAWTIEVHTLTIVNGETTTEIKFGVENDGTLDATVAELAWILEGELPAETETHTYAWDVAVPETFELKDYTFTVVATEKEVNSESSDTTSEENKPAKSGCGSAIGSTLAITGIALAASALIIKKRKED
ncbi:MAG: hypothetical protein IJ308_03930 [Clostridia bacterium]|nr:hypothetical protein [Clostridia bacterium]